MNLRAVFLLLFCSLLITPIFSQSKKQSGNPSTALLTINKKTVTAEEFIYLYRKNHQNPTEDFTKQKIEEYLTLYTNFKLKVEEARRRGMDTTASFKREFNQYKDELRKPYMPGNGLTDSLVRMTYDRMKEEVRASHILISLKPDATPADTLKAFNKITEIRNRVIAGEDFAKLAEELSDDPSAKANKGDLGYFTALQMVYAFENAAYTTPVGQVSKIVKTRFGYHILKVFDRRPTGGEVEVSHIMIRTGEAKDKTEARNQIFSIYDQLQAGVKWDELCKQYSDDPGTKESGGRLRPFRSGMMSQVPEFERVAFELEKPGQYSDPFETQFGWHIVKLERKIPLGSFEELATGLKAKVSRDERSEVSKQALQGKLRSDLGFTEQKDTKGKIFNYADSTLQKATWKKTIDKNLMKEKLFELNKKQFKVLDFVNYVYEKQQANSMAPAKYIEQLYNNYVDEAILTMQEEQIRKNHPEYQFLINEYYEGILLFEIMEKEVWNKASEDSAGQHKYYDSHISNYMAGERAKASIYSASDVKILEGLRSELKANDPRKIQEYTSKHKIKSESGYFKKEDKVAFRHIPWETGIHNAEVDGIYYLVWLKEVLPEGKMSFEEARPTVVSDYQTYLENSWLDQLKAKYKVTVNQKGKEYILSQLEKK
jgi:peptidyl-prolyl cis-trans isomerase SurA